MPPLSDERKFRRQYVAASRSQVVTDMSFFNSPDLHRDSRRALRGRRPKIERDRDETGVVAILLQSSKFEFATHGQHGRVVAQDLTVDAG
jgi:hypothetical protein